MDIRVRAPRNFMFRTLLSSAFDIAAIVRAVCMMLALQCFLCSAVAGEDEFRRPDQLTFYHGRGTDSNLNQLPKQIITADIPWESSYFEGVAYTHYLPSPQWIDAGLSLVGIGNASTAIELIGVKHHGMQKHFEADIAYFLRTDEGRFGPLRVRVGAGIGFSYAFGRPTYEDGPLDNPTRRYRFQNYNALEIELGAVSEPRLSFVGRIHHRSGLYGIIAPRNVGSNFITIGIRINY